MSGLEREQPQLQPARAPLPWPVSLVIAAVGISGGVPTRHARGWKRWLPAVATWIPATVTRTALERRRARQLGLRTATAEPHVPRRVSVSLGAKGLGMHVAVSDPMTFGVLPQLVGFANTGLAWACRRRRAPQPTPRWELSLASELSLDLLRRYDWRRAKP